MQKIRGLTHDHIDGSAAMIKIIWELHMHAGKEFPFNSIEAWVNFFQDPHENIVKRFSTVNDVLQTREALEAVGYTYGKHRAEEGYVYVEAKFAPHYYTRGKDGDGRGALTMRQATYAICEGLWRAETEFGIRILPQLCINREADPEIGIEIAKICLDSYGQVALDTACDEANHPPEKHVKAYRTIHESSVKVKTDCHAGEWVSPEPKATYQQRLLKNIQTALYDLKVDGISHALPLIHDPDSVAFMADNGIRLSSCPASYKHMGLISDIRELGLPELLDAGVICTINTDDDLFLPPMPEVITACQDIGLSEAHWQQLADNVFRGAFARGPVYF